MALVSGAGMDDYTPQSVGVVGPWVDFEGAWQTKSLGDSSLEGKKRGEG